MGRPLLVLGAAVALVGTFVIACGGGDKPPLTPDTTEPASTVEGPDGAAPPIVAPAPPSAPSK